MAGLLLNHTNHKWFPLRPHKIDKNVNINQFLNSWKNRPAFCSYRFMMQFSYESNLNSLSIGKFPQIIAWAMNRSLTVQKSQIRLSIGRCFFTFSNSIQSIQSVTCITFKLAFQKSDFPAGSISIATANFDMQSLTQFEIQLVYGKRHYDRSMVGTIKVIVRSITGNVQKYINFATRLVNDNISIDTGRLSKEHLNCKVSWMRQVILFAKPLNWSKLMTCLVIFINN